METEVAIVFYINSAPIRAGGTFRFMRAGADTAASEWAAVFVRVLYGVIAPWAHFMPGGAEGVPGFIEGGTSRGIPRGFRPAIDVDESIDIPAFQQLIDWEAVMRGVKAYVFRGDAKGITPEIIYGIKEVPAVMAACVGKLH